MENLTIGSDSSLYLAESGSSDSSGTETNLTLRRLKLNEFLNLSGKEAVKRSKKKWEYLSTRTKNVRISEAKHATIASLEVICPEDPGSLWESLKSSKSVEKALGTTSNLLQCDKKYLSALAETYQNAVSWDTRRQVLSIMADLVPSSVIQQYIPGITEYRIKAARNHKFQYGRGAPLPVIKSPRMRVNDSQLDHFLSFITSPHIVQDLPFGQRYLRLSNGKILETPNVIRSIIPQRIIDQYQQFCSETDFTPFSKSTMLRILASCSATVRKSLKGLDYFTVEGAKAFDDLISVAQKLGDHGQERQWVERCEKALKEGKQYLKADYKVHITENTSVPDHCRVYALSDPNEKLLRVTCDHSHDQSCSSCDSLKQIIQEINSSLRITELIDEDRDNLTYLFQQAVQAVEAWKAHQLRSIQQDKARTDCLDKLDATTVLITQDWAMKFLPQKYRETQADWFAKRGISWHISVIVRMLNGKLQHQAFVHIAENCSQDSDDVAWIIHHTLLELKKAHPEIKTAFLRQDNAGCYHSVVMLAACHIMEKETGIKIQRVDFSDPQGGKVPCDRKAATIKAHVRRYIDEGHDVLTAADFKEALLSYGGVNGVRVVLVDLGRQPLTTTEGKLEGVSTFNNFCYDEKGITVWKAYDIGKGKLIPWSTLRVRRSLSAQDRLSNTQSLTAGDFVDVRSVTQVKEHAAKKDEESATTDQGNGLFSCPVDGCICTFLRHSSLEQHMFYGKCKMIEERHSLLDKAQIIYRDKLLEGASAQPFIAGNLASTTSTSDKLPQGWALRVSKKGGRYNDNQKQYLNDKFLIGQQTGHKVDPEQVAHDMRYAKNDDGSRRFRIEEFLSAQQIKSYFSRTAGKLRQGIPGNIDESDAQAAEDEAAYSSARERVIQECQVVHPITYDTYNICDMHASSKLKKLSIAMLRLICNHFDMDTDAIPGTRKAPFIELISELVASCSCNES